MDLVGGALQRPVILVLALAGAAAAVAGTALSRPGSPIDRRLAVAVTRLGYLLTGASLAIFIAAGFVDG